MHTSRIAARNPAAVDLRPVEFSSEFDHCNDHRSQGSLKGTRILSSFIFSCDFFFEVYISQICAKIRVNVLQPTMWSRLMNNFP